MQDNQFIATFAMTINYYTNKPHMEFTTHKRFILKSDFPLRLANTHKTFYDTAYKLAGCNHNKVNFKKTLNDAEAFLRTEYIIVSEFTPEMLLHNNSLSGNLVKVG